MRRFINELGRQFSARRIIHVGIGLTTLYVPSIAQSQTPQTAQGPNVLVWRTVRNDFHDRAISPQFVAQLVERSPSTRLKIGAGETLSSQLQKSFNVSSTWTPQLYQQMVSRIAELNSLVDVNNIPASAELLVPQVPNVGKKYNKRPLSWSGQTVKTALTWSHNAVSDFSISKSAPIGAAPQQEVQYFSVPLSDVGKYLLPGLAAQGAGGPVKINLAQGFQSTGLTTVINSAAASLVQSKLSASTNGVRPTVVVVDDSIPDSSEYAASKAFVLELSKTIRTSYGLGDSQFIAELESLPNSLVAENADTLYPNLRTHASLIKHSLAEFKALDGGKSVAVIYIPLAATQIGVAPLLKEIVYLGQLLKIVRPSYPPTMTASQSQRNQAKQLSEIIFKGNPSTFSLGALSPLGANEMSIITDSLLLESIGIVLSFYGDVTSQPHMLSFSWTTPPLTFPTYFESGTYGLKFAAAGNQSKPPAITDFLQLKLDYARRAATSQDFVVVMNSTGSDGGCPSNVFDDSGLAVASVSFPGNVTDTYCGTSFATPRVAWLIAAKEATSGKRLIKPISEHAKLLWLTKQHAAILQLKQAGQTDILGRYKLNVHEYFSN